VWALRYDSPNASTIAGNDLQSSNAFATRVLQPNSRVGVESGPRSNHDGRG
jgi:hypothetical protein